MGFNPVKPMPPAAPNRGFNPIIVIEFNFRRLRLVVRRTFVGDSFIGGRAPAPAAASPFGLLFPGAF